MHDFKLFIRTFLKKLVLDGQRQSFVKNVVNDVEVEVVHYCAALLHFYLDH